MAGTPNLGGWVRTLVFVQSIHPGSSVGRIALSKSEGHRFESSPGCCVCSSVVSTERSEFWFVNPVVGSSNLLTHLIKMHKYSTRPAKFGNVIG